jgi:indole-3-glycerol phosphate synthase
MEPTRRETELQEIDKLSEILRDTRATLPSLRRRAPEFERAASGRPPAASFRAVLRGQSVALIAEVKRRSPSAGSINEGLDPAALAAAYAKGGAAAISVLTEVAHFGGSIADLGAVVGAVDRPVLRKDFIVDEVQLLEARAAGASAALLIVRALEQEALVRLLRFAGTLGLDVLVETHDRRELERALDTDAAIIGVNARNLDTFEVDAAAAWELLQRIPADRVAVAESGMASVLDVQGAADAGADAVLIGSALARSGNPAECAAEFSRVGRHAR